MLFSSSCLCHSPAQTSHPAQPPSAAQKQTSTSPAGEEERWPHGYCCPPPLAAGAWRDSRWGPLLWRGRKKIRVWWQHASGWRFMFNLLIEQLWQQIESFRSPNLSLKQINKQFCSCRCGYLLYAGNGMFSSSIRRFMTSSHLPWIFSTARSSFGVH